MAGASDRFMTWPPTNLNSHNTAAEWPAAGNNHRRGVKRPVGGLDA
jgi:hypothetical protein